MNTVLLFGTPYGVADALVEVFVGLVLLGTILFLLLAEINGRNRRL